MEIKFIEDGYGWFRWKVGPFEVRFGWEEGSYKIVTPAGTLTKRATSFEEASVHAYKTLMNQLEEALRAFDKFPEPK